MLFQKEYSSTVPFGKPWWKLFLQTHAFGIQSDGYLLPSWDTPSVRKENDGDISLLQRKQNRVSRNHRADHSRRFHPTCCKVRQRRDWCKPLPRYDCLHREVPLLSYTEGQNWSFPNPEDRLRRKYHQLAFPSWQVLQMDRNLLPADKQAFYAVGADWAISPDGRRFRSRNCRDRWKVG